MLMFGLPVEQRLALDHVAECELRLQQARDHLAAVNAAIAAEQQPA